MDLEYSRQLLCLLIENSARILRSGFGVDRAEGNFFQIIDLLREEPSLRDFFLELVGKTLEDRDPSGLGGESVPRELSELVAHEMRWPEFMILAQKRIDRYFYGDDLLAVGDVSKGIVLALDDNWPDREFYVHYNP